MKFFTLIFPVLILFSCNSDPGQPGAKNNDTLTQNTDTTRKPETKVPDSIAFNRYLRHMLHEKDSLGWPVKSEYPGQGALLPSHRIIAFYGNLYSKGMGVLGALPEDSMLKKLQAETKKWQQADTIITTIPALHYIAVTAQKSPGAGSKYRLRMPHAQIDRVIEMANRINAIVFIDVQTGHSSVQEEIPLLEKYLSMPNVHLGIDPEYSMKGGQAPGSVIGTMDASDINYTSSFLSELVSRHNLPPKLLIVHRFTKNMVTNYSQIKTDPNVQIVVHMDGFGSPAKKLDTYRRFVMKEPVQFTGFKIFYKNDITNGQVMQPEEVLRIYPRPLYIQYQ